MLVSDLLEVLLATVVGWLMLIIGSATFLVVGTILYAVGSTVLWDFNHQTLVAGSALFENSALFMQIVGVL